MYEGPLRLDMEWHLGRAFQVEAAKREIERCDDVPKLRDVCINLMLQVEAQRDMIGQLLLRD